LMRIGPVMSKRLASTSWLAIAVASCCSMKAPPGTASTTRRF
jgi:hypothetical protein